MDANQNARTTPHSRQLIVDRLAQGWTVSAVAAAPGIDPTTARKWRDRFAREGPAGLVDRSSCPHTSPTRLDEPTQAEIVRLRRQRLPGPAIARQMHMPLSTVGAVLRQLGLGRRAALDSKPLAIRYERERPGELVHLDTKKLGRIDGIGHRITGRQTGTVRSRRNGWDHLHVAVDDASRLAYTKILPDDCKESAAAFLEQTLAFFGRHGVTVERIMTDNGSVYQSHLFRDALVAKAIKHKRTRPYTPRTNGKASASSNHPYANGPMPSPSPTPPREARPCFLRSEPTITPGPAQPSADTRPSAD